MIAVVGIIAHKLDRSPAAAVPAAPRVAPSSAEAPTSKEEVVLVADLSEANEKGDNCAEIIHLVSAAGKRGVKIREFPSDSHSPLIKRYHVLTIPTLLVLDDGKVVSRYEGESGSTVREIRTRLSALRGAKP